MTFSILPECRYAECHYAECHLKALYAECLYAEHRYVECHYNECRYAECCGALFRRANQAWLYHHIISFHLKRGDAHPPDPPLWLLR